VLTENTIAVKLAVVDRAATFTKASTVTAELLLARLTAKPPIGAAALRVTVQLSVPTPVIEPLVQFKAINTGTFELSCSAKVLATPLALAVSVTVCAVLTAETVAVKLAVLAPAATVTLAGTATAVLSLARLTANPPLSAAAFSVTVQLSVPAPVIDPFVQVSALKTGALALSCSVKVLATLLALAVRVTVWAVLTEETVAVKLAVVAPAGTITEAGTVTADLLLATLTAKPPVSAAAFSVTVQLSVPAPVIDPLVQLSPLNTGKPVPLRLITVDVPLDELLVKVSWPAAAPAVVGSN